MAMGDLTKVTGDWLIGTIMGFDPCTKLWPATRNPRAF